MLSDDGNVNFWRERCSCFSRSPVCLQVINVDDDGNELSSGVMEVTEFELVLRTQRRNAIRWPYVCLRRYGYDSNLFSFECGRRCQTGQGTSPSYLPQLPIRTHLSDEEKAVGFLFLHSNPRLLSFR